MDDQRCSLTDNNRNEEVGNRNHENGDAEPKVDFMEFLAGAQSSSSSRESSQRQPPASSASAGIVLPGLNKSKQPEILQRLSVATTDKDSLPDDTFFEQLMKMQGTRIEDQRSSLPGVELAATGVRPVSGAGMPAPTIPDEDFFSLICRLQGGRIDDQRASLPSNAWPRRNGVNNEGPKHSDL